MAQAARRMFSALTLAYIHAARIIDPTMKSPKAPIITGSRAVARATLRILFHSNVEIQLFLTNLRPYILLQ